MVVVSDTTPLNILIRIELIDLLPSLFGDVIVPPAVIAELRHVNTPSMIREWLAK